MSNPKIILPTVEGRTILHEGFCTLRQDDLRLPNGELYPYFTVTTRKQAVMVVGTTPDGQFLLIEEYRHAVGRVVLGAAGGFIEAGEAPSATAHRELLEETGYAAGSMRMVGSSFPVPGLLDQQIFFFHADEVAQVAQPRLEAAEALRPVLMTQESVWKAAREGQAMDSSLCAALFFMRMS